MNTSLKYERERWKETERERKRKRKTDESLAKNFLQLIIVFIFICFVLIFNII